MNETVENETEKQQWKKEAVLCMKEKRENEITLLIELIGIFKTIHEDHHMHLNYLAKILNFNKRVIQIKIRVLKMKEDVQYVVQQLWRAIK